MPSIHENNFVETFRLHYSSLDKHTSDTRKNKLNRIKFEAFDYMLKSHCECFAHVRYLYNKVDEYTINFGL